MIQTRLSDRYDDRLRRHQYGFRKIRGTEHPLFILRRLQDYSLRTGTQFHCLFIDWKQAFDKVDHQSMLTAIRRLGIHERSIDIISDVYTNPTFHTIGIQGDVSTATPHTGIRQGCPLSPYLFIMVLSVILADVDTRLMSHGTPQTRGRWVNPHMIWSMQTTRCCLALAQKYWRNTYVTCRSKPPSTDYASTSIRRNF